MQKLEQAMNLFIPYIYLYEETASLLDNTKVPNLLNFIVDWIINERVKSFSYIIIPE